MKYCCAVGQSKGVTKYSCSAKGYFSGAAETKEYFVAQQEYFGYPACKAINNILTTTNYQKTNRI